MSLIIGAKNLKFPVTKKKTLLPKSLLLRVVRAKPAVQVRVNPVKLKKAIVQLNKLPLKAKSLTLFLMSGFFAFKALGYI